MIAFHFRAGAEIGTGHARRCAVLADALVESGSDIILISDRETIAFSHDFMPKNCVFLETDGSIKSIVASVTKQRPSDLVLDRYDLDNKTEEALLPLIERLIVLDDFSGRAHTCDIQIDQNIGKCSAAWKQCLPEEPLMLAGSFYALLRPEFARARLRNITTPATRSQTERVFVCFGGTDPHGLTNWLRPALEMVLRSGRCIDIVAGNGTKHLSRIKAFSDSHRNVNLHVASANVAALMVDASIAIGAPGSMTLERACVGLPQILVSFADNQIEVGELAAEQGVARYFGNWQDLHPEDIGQAALDLFDGTGAAEAMAKRAFQLVDGRGARRTATALLPETNRNGDPVRLRPMQEADAEIVFQWQNADGMRRYSHNPAQIAWNDHQSWMFNRLQNFPLETYVAYDGDRQPLGLCHLRRHDDEGWWVSILVAPGAQGKGTGQAILRQIGRIYLDELLYARIKSENAASIQMFQSADFVNAGDVYIRKPAVEIVT